MAAHHMDRPAPAAAAALRRLPLLCALLLAATAARAHLPELFGRDFVLEPAPASAAAQDADEITALQRARDIEALETVLEALEMDAGPYAGGLSDPFIQLASLYERQGNTVGALRSLDRALHVLRINNGLLHPAQLPILRRLPALYAAIGDYESAQLAWRYAYRVNGMGQGVLDEQALQDALDYFQFVRDAFIAPGSRIGHRRFLQGYRDNEALYERLLESEDTQPEVLVAVGISQLRNLYISLGTDLSSEAGLGAADTGAATYQNMLTMQTLGLRKGLDIIDALLEKTAAAPPMARATLQLRRANWLQWNGKWRSAGDDYRAAVALLDDSAAAERLRARLAQPALLPEDPVLWRVLQGDDVPVRAVVSASFEISERGDASGVTTVAEGDANSALAGRIRRMLSDSHFRPALGAEGPFTASVANRRYRLLD